jgi:OOP family OmpA-OmpF porin
MHKIVVALIAILIANPAYSEGSKSYLLAEYGSVTYTNISPFPNPGKFGLGLGYMVNDKTGLELGYTMFGDSTLIGGTAQATISASSFHPAIVTLVPLNPQFNLLAKVGMAMNKADATSNFGSSASTSKTSLYYALGAQFNVSPQVGWRLQYENFGSFEDATAPMSASAFTGGVVLNF